MVASVVLLAVFSVQDPVLAEILKRLRDQVAPCVVSIEVLRDRDPEGRAGSGPSGAHADYYNRPEGPCTGTIWSADGTIVTSAFNVSGDVRRVMVRLAGGKRVEAKRLGYDRTRDIALLKIDATDLPALPPAKPEEVRQGDFVAVVGRAPDPDVATINQGILSAVDRMKSTAVQTDAELNYGNVGGPLVNLRGELIGVTCHIKPRSHWGQSGGVGFACKLAEIEKVLPELKAGRSIERAEEPWLGVVLAEGAQDVEGVVIAQVAAHGPAEEAGLREGDVITDIDGRKVRSQEDVQAALATKKVGDGVAVKFRRIDPQSGAAEDKEVKVKLGADPG
ncbi:MAG: trypsin-like peptidase domain-containing protein [Planctomycetes bacterium]|nr:trypsin-like peptidase domain-containing protein [Planctomycetota bacterium]